MLYGHDVAVAAFRGAFEEGRLHHAWLISGPQGIGKATFADKAALRVLAQAAGPAIDLPGLEVPPEHRIARLVAAGSHPDLMRLERLTKDSGTSSPATSISSRSAGSAGCSRPLRPSRHGGWWWSMRLTTWSAAPPTPC